MCVFVCVYVFSDRTQCHLNSTTEQILMIHVIPVWHDNAPKSLVSSQGAINFQKGSGQVKMTTTTFYCGFDIP